MNVLIPEWRPIRGKRIHRKCWITYFVLAESAGLVKIGRTRQSVHKRLAELKTMSAVPLCLIGQTTIAEQVLHGAFAEYRQHGEWFTYCGRLQEFIEQLASLPPKMPQCKSIHPLELQLFRKFCDQ